MQDAPIKLIHFDLIDLVANNLMCISVLAQETKSDDARH